VYNPAAEIVPVFGLSDQVTPPFAAYRTVAVSCCVCPAFNVADAGATVTATGINVTVTDPLFVTSAMLVAIAVTVCCAATAGAVYNPAAEIVPVFGLNDHVTPLLLPNTDAVNCCVWFCPSVAEPGVTATGGMSVTVAVPFFVLSMALVAVTVTVCCVVIVAGAV
jgi:hypothetical protein